MSVQVQPDRQPVDVVERQKAEENIVLAYGAHLSGRQRLVHVGDQVVVRQHDPFRQAGGAAGEGKGGQRDARIALRLGQVR